MAPSQSDQADSAGLGPKPLTEPGYPGRHRAPTGARALARAEIERRLLVEARRQLAAVGPAQLSVRAIARELGMASSAVYRYVKSRDDLLTWLLVVTYDELADRLTDADRELHVRGVGHQLATRYVTFATTLRSWALEHPQDYGLLYGSPVPGYAAPDDTIGPATRVTSLLVALVQDATSAGVTPVASLRVPEEWRNTANPLREHFNRGATTPVPDETIHAALLAWCQLIGGISLELFGHFNQVIIQYDSWFEQAVAQQLAWLGYVDASGTPILPTYLDQ